MTGATVLISGPDFAGRTGVWAAARLALILLLLSAAAASAALFRVDGTGGADGPSCGSTAQPCASIQQAVDLSASGDFIFVAAGTYTGNTACLGEAAVVCIVHRELTILGGFGGGDWTSPDPQANATTIDGQSARRGLIVRRSGADPELPATSLRLEGVTVRNGLADEAGHQFGGGLKALIADIVLRDVVFEDNRVEAPTGQLAGGGGASIQGAPELLVSATLERLEFSGNEVLAGDGRAGSGGGLHADHAVLTGFDLYLHDNQAEGGAGGDGLGGGLSLTFGADVELERVRVEGNTARGGDAVSVRGGFGFGGGVFIEGSESDATAVDLLDSSIRTNTSLGGAGTTAGGGSAGGLMSFGGDVTIDRCAVIGNSAMGGDSGAGSSGGGGIYGQLDFASLLVRNSIVARNEINGAQGGGAGLRLLGTTATVEHTTFADNRSVGGNAIGLAILAGPDFTVPSDLTLDFSIIADHATPSTERAVHAQATASAGSTVTLTRNLFAGNSHDTNDGEVNSGTFNNLPGDSLFAGSTPSAFFVSAGTLDFHITNVQPPRDDATASTEPVDLDGAARSGDLPRDMGADEYGVSAFRLTVEKRGLGAGVVTATPSGVDCGPQCSAIYASGEVVSLVADPAPGFGFVSFGGDADCADGSVTMSQDVVCEAGFTVSTELGTLVIEKATVPTGRPESFGFSGPGMVSLSDGQQMAFGSLEPGVYTATEAAHPMFDLTAVSCDDDNSSGSVGALTATYRIEPGEIVTCTFTNELTSCSAAQDDLVLPDEVVGDLRVVEACASITAAAYVIDTTGNVTMRSLSHVLQNGFAVNAGGALQVFVEVP
jgi:hypothetical protein